MLHNYKRDNSPGRHDNIKCICTYEEIIKIYGIKPQKNSREKHKSQLQLETLKPLSVSDRPNRQKIMRIQSQQHHQ